MAYKLIEGGGVTTPKGFLAGACYVGVKSRKSEKPDVAIIYSEQPATCAALFTTNKFCAAPVILDREILKKGKARAVVINSGNANAATGEQGIKDAKLVETEAEKLLGAATPTPPPASRASRTPSWLRPRPRSCWVWVRTRFSSAPPASSARSSLWRRCWRACAASPPT